MKKTIYLAIPLFAIILTSCNKELGTTDITYTRSTAIYGDFNEIRSTPLIGSVQSIDNPGKIYVSDAYLLIGEEEKGIHILDNSNPENPTHIGFVNVPGNKEFFVENGYIYAESYYDMLKIDINDIRNPKLINRVENYLNSDYLGDGSNAVIGFKSEKVTEALSDERQDIWDQIYAHDEVLYDYRRAVIPHSAVPASFAGSSSNAIGSVNRITRTKGHVYAVSHERMAVFTDDDELVNLGVLHYGSRMETVYPNGDALFIGGATSVDIINITDPANPLFFGSFWHETSCDPVYPHDDVAYVTLRTGDDEVCPGDVNSLITLNISNLSNPFPVSEYEMESPYGVMVIGERLYVGEGDHGLKIFDISDRFSPELIKYDDALPAYDIIRHPSRTDVILIAGPDGFGQYDVSDDHEFSILSWISY